VNLSRDPPSRFGEALGGTMWGGTLYELQPGEEICPYHWHFAEEEWLLVVAGTPTVRTPDGERMLQPWDVAVFVRGETGAHQVRNESGEPVRVVMLSTASDPEVCVYPDTGKVGVVAGWSGVAGTEVRGWVEPA